MNPESRHEKAINPYASPHHAAIQVGHPLNGSRDDDASAIAELTWPSVVLLILSAVWAGNGILGLLVVMTMSFGGKTTELLTSRELFFIIPTTLASVLVFFGALSMRRGLHYRFALATSFLACFPCMSPVVFLGIPFGFWALTVLTRSHVRSAFQRKALSS